MTAPLIIGITGQKRCGKDTVGKLIISGLQQELGPGQHYIEESFAAPIRNMVAGMLGFTSQELEEFKELPIEALGGKTPREMMQTLGTEWGRNLVHEHVWLHAAKWRVEREYKEWNGYSFGDDDSIAVPLVLFTDVRFDNEAQMIRDMGGVILCIKRAATDKTEFEHASEAGMRADLVDVWHNNNGTLGELRDNVIDRGLPLLRLAAQERHAEQHQGDVYQ